MEKMSIPNFRVFTWMMVFFLVGILFSTIFNLDHTFILSLIVVLTVLQTGIYFAFCRTLFIKIFILLSLSFLTGIFLYSFRNNRLREIQFPKGDVQKVSALITSYPECGDNSQEYTVTIEQDENKTKLLVQAARYPERFYGDKILLTGRVDEPKNFDDFDYVSYLKKSGVTGIIKNPSIDLVDNNRANKVIFWLFKVRRGVETQINRNLPEPESSLASGILLGTREGFSTSLTDQFNRAGITHIIALSGYNVTIIIVAISMLLLGVVGKRVNFSISLALIILFVIMTGGASSVIRAAIISLLIVFGSLIGRTTDKANLILLAASAMAIINPFVLRYDIGFQLSFLAYIGLVYFSVPILDFLSKKKFSRIPKIVKITFAETVSAQVIVLPLLLTTFGRISIIAPISNILILPIVPLSMLIIFLSTIISVILPAIGKIAFLLSYLPLKYVLLVSEEMANLPFSSIEIKNGWQFISALIYSLLITLIIILIRNKRWTKKPTH